MQWHVRVPLLCSFKIPEVSCLTHHKEVHWESILDMTARMTTSSSGGQISSVTRGA